MASRVKHPVADADDQSGFFRNGDEFVRADQATCRMLPANQRFEADYAAFAIGDLRLVMQLKLLTGLDRDTQIVLQNDTIPLIRAHRRGEVQIPVLALILGLVHRNVGITYQRF